MSIVCFVIIYFLACNFDLLRLCRLVSIDVQSSAAVGGEVHVDLVPRPVCTSLLLVDPVDLGLGGVGGPWRCRPGRRRPALVQPPRRANLVPHRRSQVRALGHRLAHGGPKVQRGEAWLDP